MALSDQRITEVRADKTGSTGDENAHGGESIWASIYLSRSALCAYSDNSQPHGAGFGYEIPRDFPQVLICRHRLGFLVGGYWSGAHFGFAVNDDEQ